MNTEYHISRAASVEILVSVIPCWTPGRHKRGIPLLHAETTKQVPRLSLGVIPRHQIGIPPLDARAAPEGNRQLHIIMWHLAWFLLFFAALQSLRLSCKIAKVICWASRTSHGVGMQFESRQWKEDERSIGRLPSGVMALLLAKEVSSYSPLQEMKRCQ